MANTKIRTIRLTDEQLSTLDALAKKLNISGQRGATFQPFIQWIADTSSYALVETAAALEIASGCAAGEDWYDLIKATEPDWPAE
ncbi:hypothetical protein KC976_04115 [Candidatus Saccharibacteria bacterium]|nr:hypothetical protein [Candidatus Saccharibacteria bacterium]MCA9368114.1 hypothetical protein [Candidatus Kaiserbacteria bacterium]